MKVRNLQVLIKLKEDVIGNKVYKLIVNLINILILKLNRDVINLHSTFYYVTVKSYNKNWVIFDNTNLSKTFISLDGLNNRISIKSSLLQSCHISIKRKLLNV